MRIYPRMNSLRSILTDGYRIDIVMIIILITSTNGLMFSEEYNSNEFHSNEDYRLRRSITSMNSSLNPCLGPYIKTNGTTCGLKEIMIGRCYEYQYIKRGLFFSNLTVNKNCTELYSLFEEAVRYKSFCSMNMSTYEHYFEQALDGITLISRAMFWSGTYLLAHIYSEQGLNYITLEDTLAAGMADGLTWCGSEENVEGFNYVYCPKSCQDNPWADRAFWGLASKKFAERVGGEVLVVLNGSRMNREVSFRNSSFFATFELPNFRSTGFNRVTNVKVLLMHSPDQNINEKCGQGSLTILEELIRQAGFDYLCIDDPDDLLLIMCAQNIHARECQIARTVLKKEWNEKIYNHSYRIYSQSATIYYWIFIFIYDRFVK